MSGTRASRRTASMPRTRAARTGRPGPRRRDAAAPGKRSVWPRLQADLGDANYLMLRNHGLLTVGRSIPEAFLAMYMFETTCQIQLAAQAGGPLTTVQPEILAGVAESMRVQTGNQGGAFVWPALLRKVERLDPGYRT